MKNNTAPPIGLIPKFIHDENRLKDVIDAIERYCNAKLQIPYEWVEEYNELLSKIKAD